MTAMFSAATPATETTDKACEQLSRRLQSIDLQGCRRLQLQVATQTTRSGRPLLYRDFAPQIVAAGGLPHQRVMLVGGIHGDELSSVSIVFQWMRKLQEEKPSRLHWRAIPNLNPDGLFARPPSRMNADGVDLNRNFPSADWIQKATPYWRSRTRSDPRRYPGPRPASEPETRWLVQQIREFKPDAIISVHAPYAVLDYDGPPDAPRRFGYLGLQQLGTYPGSLGNYAGVDLELPVITLELPEAGRLPSKEQSQKIWTDMMVWLQRNLPKPRRP